MASKKPSNKLKATPVLSGQPGTKPPPNGQFPIVGVGASAGGLEAFTQLFRNLPAYPGMAFVLIQHLAPAHESMLTELLSKATAMPVKEVKDGMAVEPDNVYIIPPDKEMIIFQGVLHLMPREEVKGQHMPVDSFLRSLAQDRRNNAIAVILSGTGSDGSMGIRALKAEGGIVFAQDETAKYDGMPKSAVDTGCVDFVLPVDKIAAELLRTTQHPYLADVRRGETVKIILAEENDLNKIFIMLRSAKGVDFTSYKRPTVMRRVNRRMLLQKIGGMKEYVAYLKENPSEIETLYQDLLINVTSFFREPGTFEALKKGVFPHIVNKAGADVPVRIWVPACATGEEAYSIAIALIEYMEENKISRTVQIFATDIDDIAVEKARKGVYPENIARDVSPERLGRFFEKSSSGYVINKLVREMCIFAKQNMVKDPPFSKIDLISCRNVLIYFSPELQKKAVRILFYALNPKGFLMIGQSETVGEFAGLFSVVDSKHTIYTKKADQSILHVEQSSEESVRPPHPSFAGAGLKPALTKPALAKPAHSRRGDSRTAPADETARLREELAELKAHLNTVIQEHEAANEELSALNEELQSSNEEMQSINEEMETAKEELQSTNEELTTVNDELQSRNEETTRLNNDLANVLRGVAIPIIILGSALEIRRFNDAAARLLNLIPTDTGRPLSDIRTNINIPDLEQMVLDVTDTLRIKEKEVQDMAGRWYSLTIRPYKTVDNRIDGVLMMLVDINDLKRSLFRVREAYDYANDIVETIRESLLILAPDLKVITANKSFYENFLVSPAETEGRYIHELGNGRWNIPELMGQLKEVLPEKKSFSDFEVAIDFPDIGRRAMMLNAREIRKEISHPALAPLWEKEYDGMVLLAIEDVTEQKKSQELLKKLNKELEIKDAKLSIAYKDMESFSYSASHDLKSPLITIEGFSRILLEDYAKELDDKGKDLLNRVNNSAKKMNRLITDLFAFSRVSTKEIRKSKFNMKALVQKLVDELTPTIGKRDVKIEIKQLPSAYGDLAMINQVLTNLLINAIKFTQTRAAAIIEVGGYTENDENIYYVRDNGLGFDMQNSDKLFGLFQRIHSEKDIEGTGIGLVIVKNIIGKHGGRVWAAGRPDEGATFYFTLPGTS